MYFILEGKKDLLLLVYDGYCGIYFNNDVVVVLFEDVVLLVCDFIGQIEVVRFVECVWGVQFYFECIFEIFDVWIIGYGEKEWQQCFFWLEVVMVVEMVCCDIDIVNVEEVFVV